jgi:hypothetical protein
VGFEPTVPQMGTTVSRPRRNDRNAASQLEPASRGNVGGNESQPTVWATPYRQCRRPDDVQLLARVPSRPAACACSEPHCAPPMGKPASGAQQAGLSILVSCGANCASLRVPRSRDRGSEGPPLRNEGEHCFRRRPALQPALVIVWTVIPGGSSIRPAAPGGLTAFRSDRGVLPVVRARPLPCAPPVRRHGRVGTRQGHGPGGSGRSSMWGAAPPAWRASPAST